MYKLPPPSDEQLAIIKAVQEKNNVIVEAVAGSGKTTTALHMAIASPKLNVLLLTYNKNLKKETKDKVIKLGIKNMEVQNYHSFGVKYYGHECSRDRGLAKALKNPRKFNYDIIIIDEAQDMNPLFFEFAYHITTDQSVLCVVGDKRQSIYAFQKSSSMFLTNANAIFRKNNYAWKRLTLSISYRLNTKMAAFVNDVFLDEPVIKAVKDGPAPSITILDKVFNSSPIVQKVLLLLKSGYKPDDIMILAPSLKVKCPVRRLTNVLSDTYKIPIYVSSADKAISGSDDITGKIACLTYHRSKGLERKVVIVYGADDGYYQYNATHSEPTVCHNCIYVAITRAQEHLILFTDSDTGRAPQFMDPVKAFEYIYALNDEYVMTYFGNLLPKQQKPQERAVCELLQHIPEDDLEVLLGYFDRTQLTPPGKHINIASTISGDDVLQNIHNELSENISDINGTAIPAYYAYKTTGKFAYQNDFTYDGTIPALLERTNWYFAETSGYTHMLNQIRNYTWLPHKIMQECVDRLKNHIPGIASFEVYAQHKFEHNDRIRVVSGAADAIHDGVLWEFKCTAQLEIAHFLQVIVYVWLMNNIGHEIKECRLFNILTGELWRINVNIELAEKTVCTLFDLKEKNHEEESDKSFSKLIKERSKTENR